MLCDSSIWRSSYRWIPTGSNIWPFSTLVYQQTAGQPQTKIRSRNVRQPRSQIDDQLLFVNLRSPVERIDGSPQLGLPSESLIKAEGFWDYFLGMLCYVSKTLYFSSVFGSFVLEICVSPRSLGGGGSPGRAGSASPASSGLSCCHEFVSFFCRY